MEKNWTIEISQKRKVKILLHIQGVLWTGVSLGWGLCGSSPTWTRDGTFRATSKAPSEPASTGAETFGLVTPSGQWLEDAGSNAAHNGVIIPFPQPPAPGVQCRLQTLLPSTAM